MLEADRDLGERIVVDRARLEELVVRAVEARENKEGIFAQKIIPPEEYFIKLAREYGEREYGERAEVFALHALFFLSTTIFADNSTTLLRRVSRPESFEAYAWLFDPVKVVSQPEKVEEAAKQYIKPGYNVNALSGWGHNARVILEKYDGNLRNFFAEHNYDAPFILEALVGPKRKVGYEGFRRFGQKIGSLFLLWVDAYQLAELKRIEEIGVPVDFQVIRLAVQTGAVKLPLGEVHKHHLVGKLVPVFKEICKEISEKREIHPDFISKSLWNIGHLCCNKYGHSSCPLEGMCERLISRRPLDRKGLIVSEDVGRHETRGTLKAKKRRAEQIAAGQKTLFP